MAEQPVQLDPVDRSLIEALRVDSRQSVNDLAVGSDGKIDVRRRGALRPCAVEVNAFSSGNVGPNFLLQD